MSDARRWTVPAALAALVTTAILLLMQSLVVGRQSADGTDRDRRVLDFIRLKRDTTAETRDRRRPEKPAVTAPPAVPRLRTERAPAPDQQVARVPMPPFDPSLVIAGRPSLGSATPDSAAVPLVRVPPQYPPRAQARGIEGRVLLRFTVTPQGTTDDVEVIDAEPKGYFERAAKQAVRRYKFKPRVENGVPVASPGKEIEISFEIDE